VAEIVTGMLPPNAEWRATVRRRGLDNELYVEAEADLALCRAVENAFHDRAGLGVTVVPAEGGSIARSREKTQRIMVEESLESAGPPNPARRGTC
jgi:phenylacetate-CoA ligase